MLKDRLALVLVSALFGGVAIMAACSSNSSSSGSSSDASVDATAEAGPVSDGSLDDSMTLLDGGPNVRDGDTDADAASPGPCTGKADGTPVNATEHCCGSAVVQDSDPKNCGLSCSACSLPPSSVNASATCAPWSADAGPQVDAGAGFACGVSCDAGWGRCGADTTCSTSLSDSANCGSCGHACTTSDPHATVGCTSAASGQCSAPTCVFPWAMCTGDTTCATQLGNDTQCGSCTDNCTAIAADPNANVSSASCAAEGDGGAYSCSLQCDSPFADCDGIDTNGCETDTSSDPANCGGCGISCTSSIPGVGGTCDQNSTTCDCGSNGCTANSDNGLPAGVVAGQCVAKNNGSAFCGDQSSCNWCAGWKAHGTCNTSRNDCCEPDPTQPSGICCQGFGKLNDAGQQVDCDP